MEMYKEEKTLEFVTGKDLITDVMTTVNVAQVITAQHLVNAKAAD